jgi:hypothetical protein
VLLVSAPSEKAFLWDMPLVIANRLTDRRGEERLMTQLVKTAPYLAPERARGAKATAEADVYALGAIICVAGGAPLPVAETTLAVVHAVVNGTWQPKVPKSIPEPLRSMLERMIARAPGERPTAREVADLFMPPVAARPTLREMAAVVLPPAVESKPFDIRLSRPTAPAAPVIDAQVPAKVDKAMLDATDPLEAVLPEAKATAPVRTPPPAPAVQLSDTVSVSSELHADGAVQLSAEEAALLSRPSRKAPLMMAAVMVVLVTVLAALAIDLAHRGPAIAAPMAHAPVKSVVVVTPPLEPSVAAPVAASDDELLSPLTPSPRPAKKSRRVRTAQVSAEAEAAPAAAPQHDFGFLEDEQELKRPSF